MFRNMKIGKKLIIVISFLLILSSAGIGFFSYRVSSEALKKTIEESLVGLAKESAKYIRVRMDNDILGIEGVANRLVIRSMEWEAKQKPALENETKRLGYLGMGIVLPDGTAKYPDGKTANLGDRQYVKEAFSGKTVLSDVIISRVTNQAVIMLAAPIRDLIQPDKISAVLIARLDGNVLSEITDKIKYGEKGYSYIINEKGALIAHNNRNFVMESRNFLKEGKTNPEYSLLSEMMQEMADGKTGYREYWFMGSDRLFGFTSIPNTGWSIAVGAVQDEVFKDVYSIRILSILISLFFIVLGIIFALVLAKSFTRPIETLKSVSHALTLGDLTLQVEVKSKDEIGQMGEYFNQLIQKLKAMIEKIIEGNQQIDLSVTEINQGNQDLSKRVEAQSSSLEETAAAIEEMGSNIKTSAENTSLAKVVMQKTMNSVSNGNEKIKEAALFMEKTASETLKIKEIVKIIEGIAFQTNILALNAAVEAARAKEHGKGFAVVANEVRSLAQKTSENAKQISFMVESVVKNIGQSNQMVSVSMKDFNLIYQNIENVSGIINEINHSAKEHSEASDQIQQAVVHLDNLNQTNSSLVEEIAGSSEELKNQTEEIMDFLTFFKTK
ncbi:MAG: hypothetical protein A2Y41_04135 [Spirochaetes bacterium GWB1_36_13]|nr:MAG: hypothetical protein A2Y41_04135 [Spirochaetes bacterium GWB1_36_13]